MKIHKSSLTKSNDISLIHESSKFFFSYKTYLVHEAALFSFCHQCMSIDVCVSKLVLGSFLRVIQKCNCCNKETKWDSQPFVRNIPEGNLLMSAGILFTGCLPEPSIRMFQTMGCACISRSTFYYHQSHYLHPAIFHIWDIHQQSFFSQLSDDDHGLILGGDGRSDSPGHSAKYGSYSLVELTHNAVIDIQLVQVRCCIYAKEAFNLQ